MGYLEKVMEKAMDYRLTLCGCYSEFFPLHDLFSSDQRSHTGPLFTETTKTTQAKTGESKLSAMGPFRFFKNFFNVTYKTGRD